MTQPSDDIASHYSYDEEFRNTVATVDEKGRRVWMYPKKPGGRLHRLRIVLAVFLLALLFSGPFIRIDGQPLLLLNILERKFILFGMAFWPQDFVLLALVLITFFVIITLFTVVFGRIWCGWLCPQTLFMEMVFRKIEYWIEGDANEQRRLNKEPWNTRKIFKKTMKHGVFFLISLLIAFTTLGYILGSDHLTQVFNGPLAQNSGLVIGLTAFTFIFYGVFTYLREQVCVAICPYGRLQGVLLIKDSIVVMYDWIRGEPRGKLKKTTGPEIAKGDCIDCKLCVHVCPTGIDIRNGTQLECVNCTACIDACDEVMVKIGKPKGLIRYASITSIQKGIQNLFSPRVIAYSIVLVSLFSLLGFMLSTRSDVETTMLKIPGTLYQKKDGGIISNLYNIEFVNKTFDELHLELKVLEPQGATLVRPGEETLILAPEGFLKTICFVDIPGAQLTSASTRVSIGVFNKSELIETVTVKFIGPVSGKKK